MISSVFRCVMRIPAVTADLQWFYYRVNGVLQGIEPRLLTCCLRGCWCRSWLTGPHPHLALCFFPPEQEEGFVCRMLKHLSIHRETEGTNWLLCTLQEALHLKSCFCRLKQTQIFFLDLLIPSTLTCFREEAAGMSCCRRWVGHFPPLQTGVDNLCLVM